LELKLMEPNITEQQYSGDLLSEPHFDEEATLLSARPVVPLHEIKAAERSSKRLTVGLALVAALVAGALGATLIYRQRGQAPTTDTVETVPEPREAQAGPPPDAGGGISSAPASPSSMSFSASATKASNVSAVPKGAPRDSAATRSRKPATPSVISVQTTEIRRDEVTPEEKWAERRAERLEARRLRQEAKREARGEVRRRRVQRSDDLLRIREIFEGPPRP
jgi:hypothetical protein